MKSTYKIGIIVLSIIGLCLFGYDYYCARINFDGYIKRPLVGERQKEIDLLAEAGEEKAILKAKVSAQKMSDEKRAALIEQAKREIDESIYQAEDSSDSVRYDLLLRESYADNNVETSFSFDPYSAISSDGVLNRKEIDDSGSIVTVKATLSLDNKDYLYEFPIILYPYKENTPEAIKYEISERIEEENESEKNIKGFTLPDKIGNKTIKWKTRVNPRGIQLFILSMVTIAAIYFGEFEDKRRKERAKNKELGEDYPKIVSTLSILMTSGLSFRGALERMCTRYLNEKRKKEGYERAGYENLLFTYREINKGLDQIQAINNFGKRANQKEYKKLALLISQSIKKGNRELIEQLENEDVKAFEIRKQLALKKGEEASTKLLLPMMGLLMIVMVILVTPATLLMNI